VLKGFGDASVLEVIESQAGNAYRAVYTVRFAAAVVVLHVFQKKSKSGIETPKPDMDLMEARLKKAAELMKESHQRGTTNVYADLGYKSADEMLVKAQLVTTIAEILTERGYTQTKAAAVLGIAQPKLSKMLRGQFRGFSERKLMDCLTLLGRDVEIVVRAATKRKGQGAVSVSFA
jgi:predicted XRE-type DNA-binding protein